MAVRCRRNTLGRIADWHRLDMRMDDPVPTFAYIAREVKSRYPELAYLHVTEPRISGSVGRDARVGEVRLLYSPSMRFEV